MFEQWLDVEFLPDLCRDLRDYRLGVDDRFQLSTDLRTVPLADSNAHVVRVSTVAFLSSTGFSLTERTVPDRRVNGHSYPTPIPENVLN